MRFQKVADFRVTIAVSQVPTVVGWRSRSRVLPIRPAGSRWRDQARPALLLAALPPQATGKVVFRLAIDKPVRPAWRLCVPRFRNGAPLAAPRRPIATTPALRV